MNLFKRIAAHFQRIRERRERMTLPATLGAHLYLDRSGWLTSRPKVHISLGSKNGSATLMTQDDTEQGNALVNDYARSWSHISGLPLLDKRKLSRK